MEFIFKSYCVFCMISFAIGGSVLVPSLAPGIFWAEWDHCTILIYSVPMPEMIRDSTMDGSKTV
jgi:hypothetical protein